MISLALLFLVVGLPVTPTHAESAVTDLVDRIDAYVAPFEAADHLSGTLLVGRGDEVLYQRSWGQADRSQKRPFQPETMSCIASVTKPTTTILAARLIEAGTIGLRDPISKWIEGFPSGDQIEFQHLLFHRAGIPHRLIGPEDDARPRSPADMVELARERGLEFEPGSRTSYSSGGFSVLARVLELASGKSYEELLRQNILAPLGLEHTVHPGTGVALAEAAISHNWTAEGARPAPEKDYSYLVGAGALFSTPRDLFAIARHLIDGGFGARARTQLLRAGRLRWNGNTDGYRAFLEYDADSDVTVAMVSNWMVGANDLLRRDLPRLVAGEVVPAPTVPQPKIVSLPVETLAAYAGRYEIGGSPMDVVARAGALFANDWVLLPTSTSTFYSPQDYATISILGDGMPPVGLDWGGMECARLGPLEP